MVELLKKLDHGRPQGSGLTSKYSKQLGFSFNKALGTNLERWRNAVLNQDIDCVVLVDGKEGSGKSVHALQIAYFLDVDREIDIDTQVCYTPEEVKKAITTLKKGKAIVFDEARRGFNRRRSTEKVNIELTDLFAECRQNNLFMVVVMPSFYDMDMNIAVWRSRVLIHVSYRWSDDMTKPIVRGYARFYNEIGKKNMYCTRYTRQMYKYPLLKNACFDYSFPHHYVVDEATYRAKKRKAESDYRTREKTTKPVCNGCGSTNTRRNKKSGEIVCRACGFVFLSSPGNTQKTTGG